VLGSSVLRPVNAEARARRVEIEAESPPVAPHAGVALEENGRPRSESRSTRGCSGTMVRSGASQRMAAVVEGLDAFSQDLPSEPRDFPDLMKAVLALAMSEMRRLRSIGPRASGSFAGMPSIPLEPPAERSSPVKEARSREAPSRGRGRGAEAPAPRGRRGRKPLETTAVAGARVVAARRPGARRPSFRIRPQSSARG
jgi:hypothetical protein